MTDTVYQSLLAPATAMDDSEASTHYYNLAEHWYHLNNSKAMKSFSKHIPHILQLLKSSNNKIRLDTIRALAFIASNPRLHRHLLATNTLKIMIQILSVSTDAADCESVLVILNHLCTQSPRENKHKYSLITDFCQDKQSLITIFRYAFVEDCI
eukprot:252619_1